jgi:hypothetical protein
MQFFFCSKTPSKGRSNEKLIHALDLPMISIQVHNMQAPAPLQPAVPLHAVA